jgi:hypothetical protein
VFACVVVSTVAAPPDDGIFTVDVGGASLKGVDMSTYVSYTVRFFVMAAAVLFRPLSLKPISAA